MYKDRARHRPRVRWPRPLNVGPGTAEEWLRIGHEEEAVGEEPFTWRYVDDNLMDQLEDEPADEDLPPLEPMGPQEPREEMGPPLAAAGLGASEPRAREARQRAQPRGAGLVSCGCWR